MYNASAQTFTEVSLEGFKAYDSNKIVELQTDNDPVTTPSMAAKASRIGTDVFVVGGMDKYWLQMNKGTINNMISATFMKF